MQRLRLIGRRLVRRIVAGDAQPVKEIPHQRAQRAPVVQSPEQEVAELMRVDRKTAYSAIAEGGIPGVRRIGRCIRVSRDELLRWLAEGQGDMRKGRRR
jgi:excisionase family DNA binding protein